jgi:hypothetical protein
MKRKSLPMRMTTKAMIALVLLAAGCAGGDQQQKADDQQQKAQVANSKLLAECADGRGGHQEVLEKDSNGNEIVFVSVISGSQVGVDSSKDMVESVGSGGPSIEM